MKRIKDKPRQTARLRASLTRPKTYGRTGDKMEAEFIIVGRAARAARWRNTFGDGGAQGSGHRTRRSVPEPFIRCLRRCSYPNET